jgi:hypothetical protein
MSLSAAVIRELIAAGLQGEALVAACERIEGAHQPQRTARQDRNARYYEARKERLNASEKRLKTTEPPFPLVPPALSPEPPLSPPYNPPTPLSGGRADAPPRQPDRFEDFWATYPKRDGANPKEPARKRFVAAVKSGADADAIIAGAKAYSASEAKRGNVGSPYIAQAVTWLTQRRWQDASADASSVAPAARDGPTMVRINPIADPDEWAAWERHKGRRLPLDKQGGWQVPSRMPPTETQGTMQ